MKIFYVPMVLPRESRHQPDACCWFVYPRRDGFRLPMSMMLAPVPNIPGGTYNHSEFLLRLLAVEPRADKWEVAVCSYTQSSLQSFIVTGIAEQCQRPGQRVRQPPVEPSASSSSGPTGETEADFSFFDMPSIFEGANAFSGGHSFHMGSGQGAVSDGEDGDGAGSYLFEKDDEEFIQSDIASEEDLQEPETPEECMVAAPEVPPADARSEGGRSQLSVASGRGAKTTATDIDILKTCLGDRQLCVCVSNVGLQFPGLTVLLCMCCQIQENKAFMPSYSVHCA